MSLLFNMLSSFVTDVQARSSILILCCSHGLQWFLEPKKVKFVTVSTFSPSICHEVQPWIFTGRTDAEAEALILWLPNAKSWLIGKDLDARKDWRQRRRGQQRMRRLVSITDSMDMSLSNSGRWWTTEKPDMLQSMGRQRVRHDWATEQQIKTPP